VDYLHHFPGGVNNLHISQGVKFDPWCLYKSSHVFYPRNISQSSKTKNLSF